MITGWPVGPWARLPVRPWAGLLTSGIRLSVNHQSSANPASNLQPKTSNPCTEFPSRIQSALWPVGLFARLPVRPWAGLLTSGIRYWVFGIRLSVNHQSSQNLFSITNTQYPVREYPSSLPVWPVNQFAGLASVPVCPLAGLPVDPCALSPKP